MKIKGKKYSFAKERILKIIFKILLTPLKIRHYCFLLVIIYLTLLYYYIASTYLTTVHLRTVKTRDKPLAK